MSYNNSLLSIIDTLQKKIQEMTKVLWDTEKNIIELQKQLDIKNEEITILQKTLRYTENEFNNLNIAYNTSSDIDKYLTLCGKYTELEGKYFNCINHLEDIEFSF